MDPSASSSISSVRIKKRKLEDAIRSLDGAVESPSLASVVERPTLLKRSHLSRSVYSALVKSGVRPREQSRPLSSSASTMNVSKNTPHLAAILARSTPQSNKAPLLDQLSMSPTHFASEYRPSSTDSFLSRLATYKITTFANKPPQIDAVAAVRCGWINDGKDRLVCELCGVSWVLASREGMNKDAASALIEKQRVSLVGMHKDGCPWKVRQCEPSVYRVPLHTPAAMVRELATTALSLGPILTNVAIKHPLTSSQLSSLHSIFSAAAPEGWVSEHGQAMDVNGTAHPEAPSDAAIVVALFGWGPPPTTTRTGLHHASSLSISSVESYGPAASTLPTPSLSRASSISSHFRGQTSTATPSASPRVNVSQFSISPDRVRVSSRTKRPRSNDTAIIADLREAPLVYCVLCQRRVGLWGYSRNATVSSDEDSALASRKHQKVFDLVKEHRSYCPYIVCSSIVPSFSHSSAVGNAMEGWRAVLAVVQRHGLSQRQRISRFLSSDDLDSQTSFAELKGVEAMVAGVKTSGGRELLRYVKGLLG